MLREDLPGEPHDLDLFDGELAPGGALMEQQKLAEQAGNNMRE